MRKVDNDRGLGTYGTFLDTYGAEIKVSESSSAERDCVWVFIKGGRANKHEAAAHLTPDHARMLIFELSQWLEYIGEPSVLK